MSYNYLDKTGLASVWEKIKAALSLKANTADLATVATSGSYEDLNDMPEVLTTNDDVVTEDKVPYLFRKSPDSDRAVEEIVGGMVGWNQLLNLESPSKMTDGKASYNSTTHEFTVTYESGDSSSSTVLELPVSGYDSNHVYLSLFKITDSASYVGMRFAFVGSTGQASNWSTISAISTVGGAITKGGTNSAFTAAKGSSTTDAQSAKFKTGCIDLTTMFGTTIADYIYSLEQSSAGAGVAKLKEWGFFTEDYYDYCEPTLRSVEGLVSKKTVGFNQWDEEWEVGAYDSTTGQPISNNSMIRGKNRIKVMPSTDYCFARPVNNGAINVIWYDGNDGFISYESIGSTVAYKVITSPSNAKYVRFYMGSGYGTTYNHDICINLSDPTRNGQYEPYESHTYSLDSEVVLRGVPKLDSNNNLYFDGDVYPADGNGSRRYALVTFDGSDDESWSYYTISSSDNANNLFRITIPTRKSGSLVTGVCELLALGYVKASSSSTGRTHLTISGSNTVIDFVNKDYSSVADWKAYLAQNPITVLYELATPTTFTAQPYHNPQIVGDTEEFVTTGIVPVGHSTKYHTSYYTTNDYIKEKGYLTEKDILGKVNTSDLATVATSGSYSDLGDTPTKVSDFENDAAYMSGMTILAYGKSNWTDFITAYTEQKVVYCRASSASNPASGSQTRLAFMAYVNSADNPTEVEFQYYRSVSSHSNNQQGDQVYVYKLTKSGGWTVTVRESYTKVVAGTGLSGNWASGAITLSLNSSATATTSANGFMSSTDKSRLDTLYADYSSALTALGVN